MNYYADQATLDAFAVSRRAVRIARTSLYSYEFVYEALMAGCTEADFWHAIAAHVSPYELRDARSKAMGTSQEDEQ